MPWSLPELHHCATSAVGDLRKGKAQEARCSLQGSCSGFVRCLRKLGTDTRARLPTTHGCMDALVEMNIVTLAPWPHCKASPNIRASRRRPETPQTVPGSGFPSMNFFCNWRRHDRHYKLPYQQPSAELSRPSCLTPSIDLYHRHDNGLHRDDTWGAS